MNTPDDLLQNLEHLSRVKSWMRNTQPATQRGVSL